MKALLACSEQLAASCAPELRARGWHVVAAHDVPTALMMANREAPDVIAVAARLPGGRGAQLVTRLRALAGTALVPVVALADEPDAAATRPVGHERAS